MAPCLAHLDLAAKNEPGALLLVAPFPAIADVVKTMPLHWPLTPFLWYDFPTQRRVESLISTCFIVAHGKNDEVIPFALGARVAHASRGEGYAQFIESDEARHDTMLELEASKIRQALERCEASM